MKVSPNCRTQKLGMIHTIFGSFCSFFNWEGANIWPQIRPRKIPGTYGPAHEIFIFIMAYA